MIAYPVNPDGRCVDTTKDEDVVELGEFVVPGQQPLAGNGEVFLPRKPTFLVHLSFSRRRRSLMPARTGADADAYDEIASRVTDLVETLLRWGLGPALRSIVGMITTACSQTWNHLLVQPYEIICMYILIVLGFLSFGSQLCSILGFFKCCGQKFFGWKICKWCPCLTFWEEEQSRHQRLLLQQTHTGNPNRPA